MTTTVASCAARSASTSRTGRKVSFQRRRDRGELRAQSRAEAVDGDDERDAGRHQTIFDGGRAPPIGEEAFHETASRLPSLYASLTSKRGHQWDCAER